MKSVAITGANGFIGREMLSFFQQQDFEVHAYVRNPALFQPENASVWHFDLHTPEKILIPSSLTALIHCAWDFSASTQSRELNLRALAFLRDECSKRNIPLIFLSSLSAHEEALSVYGKSKLEAEQMLEGMKCLVIKPGLVIGRGGLFLRMLRSIMHSRILFIPGSGRQALQIIDIADLCRITAQAIDDKLSGTLVLAHPELLTIRDFYLLLMQTLGKRPLMIPLPLPLIYRAARLLERLGIRPPVSSDSVLGLMKSRIWPISDIDSNIKLLSAQESVNKTLTAER
jgi:nucleoside-diphosphate-sugar epimerase